MFFLDFNFLWYIFGYVIGDISIKVIWEVKFLLKSIIFELRWKSLINELFMLFFGVIDIVILNYF